MKKKFRIIFLILLAGVIACNKSEEINEYYPNGNLKTQYTLKDNQKDGFLHEFYLNGSKKADYIFSKGKKDGEFILYYKNGKPKETGRFIQDKKCGQFCYYDSNGKLDSLKEFILIYPNVSRIYNNKLNSLYIYDEEDSENKSSYLNIKVIYDNNGNPIKEESFAAFVKFQKDTISIGENLNLCVNFVNQSFNKNNPFEIYYKDDKLKESLVRILPEKDEHNVCFCITPIKKGVNFFQGCIFEKINNQYRIIYFKESYFVK